LLWQALTADGDKPWLDEGVKGLQLCRPITSSAAEIAGLVCEFCGIMDVGFDARR